MKKIKAVVSGTIQNVGYRAKVIGFAKAFELTGFVHNLDDGRVQIIAEGEENNLNAFISAIQITNTLIKVDGAEVEYADVTGDLNDFYKLVGGGETDERLDKAAEYLKKLIDVAENGFSAVTVEMRSGFENLGTKMDVMLEKQDAMLEKQDAMLEKQSETTEEIRGLREDMKSYMDRKFGEIEGELDLIKSALEAGGLLNQGSIRPATTHFEI
jgi:acylphosphatase